MIRASIFALLVMACIVPGRAQQPAETARAATAIDRLLTAKIIYVAPMPDQLDEWIRQDLRAWGKYQISDNPQGVDIEMRAVTPRVKTRLVLREGTVQRKQPNVPPVLSITLVDWVTGGRLWRANILNSGTRKNQNPPPGPDTEIYARHMKPDQIAQRCVTDLRLYVTRLEERPAKH